MRDRAGEFVIMHEEYKPDIISNRSSDMLVFMSSVLLKAGIPVFPSTKLSMINADKYEMYCFFKDFQPQTLILKDFFVYPKLRESLTDRIVLKPIRSNS